MLVLDFINEAGETYASARGVNATILKGSVQEITLLNNTLLKLSGKSEKETDTFAELFSSYFKADTNITFDFSDADLTNITSMRYMFNYCYGLKHVKFGSNNLSALTTFEGFIANSSALLDVDMSKVTALNCTNTNAMFSGCYAVTSIKLPTFGNLLTDIGSMFKECNNLTNIEKLNFNVDNVTNTSYMFDSCTSLTELNLNNYELLNNTTTLRMFRSCHNLVSIFCPFDWKTNKITDSTDMFRGCEALVGNNQNWIDLSSAWTIDFANPTTGYFKTSLKEGKPLYLGNTKIDTIKLKDTKILTVYLGTNKLFESK